MTTYEVGQSIQWGLRVRDEAGAPADPATGPTATITQPDGTTAVGSVTNAEVGSYAASHVATMPGRHRVTWQAAGANSAGFPYTDNADVWPADPRFIISLADARAALNLPPGAVADDDELRLYIAATTAVIEDIAGPVLGRTHTEVHDGGSADALFLRAYPSEITSVTENGVTLTGAEHYQLGGGGVLWRTNRGWSGNSRGNVVITYTMGGDGVIAPNVILAAREQLRHMWQVGQVAARPALGGDVAPGYTPTGYAVPNRVVQLLADQIGAHAPIGMD